MWVELRLRIELWFDLKLYKIQIKDANTSCKTIALIGLTFDEF